jgi:predicted RNase H-like nuclease
MQPLAEQFAIGVDGCPGGWVYIALGPDVYMHGQVVSLERLFDRVPANGLVFIDMPIGLGGAGEVGRVCDRQARQLLGVRRSSVFATPSRAALNASSYEQACALNAAACGRKLSRQAFNILPKIREVDTIIRANAQVRVRLRESHPELNFRMFADRPMAHNKRTAEGFAERLVVLEQYWPGASEAVAAARRQLRRLRVARDDIVDAFINALAAARPRGEHIRVPAAADLDECDLPRHIHSIRALTHTARSVSAGVQ